MLPQIVRSTEDPVTIVTLLVMSKDQRKTEFAAYILEQTSAKSRLGFLIFGRANLTVKRIPGQKKVV